MKLDKLKMAILLLLVAFVSVGYAAIQEAMASFEVSPNPMEQHTTVSLSLNQKLVVTITVENAAGSVIKSLYYGELNEGNYEFNWDRYSDAGVYVPNGKYAVRVAYSSKYTSTKKTLILK